MSESDLTPTAVEAPDGRVLTGVGVSAEQLQAVMERHAPPTPEPAEPVQATTAPVEPVVEPKKPTRGQARFDALTGEREAALRQARAAEQERDALRAELETLRAQVSASPSPAATPASPLAPAPAATPEKFSYPAYDAYVAQHPEATWDDWQDAKSDALVEWKLGRAQQQFDARIRQSIEADRASRTFQTTVESVLEAGRKAYPDFDAVRETVGDIDFGPEKLQFILQQPDAHQLIYALASNRELAQQLAREPSLSQFGMGLARVTAPAAAVPASTARAGLAIAPPPYQPVGSGGTTTGTPSADLAKKGFDFDASGYREKRAAERKVRRA